MIGRLSELRVTTGGLLAVGYWPTARKRRGKRVERKRIDLEVAVRLI